MDHMDIDTAGDGDDENGVESKEGKLLIDEDEFMEDSKWQ